MASTESASTSSLLVVVEPPSPTGTPPPASRPSSSHSSPSEPPKKVLTYKYGTQMAYVARMEEYQEAVQLVRATWPVLSTIPDERISFKINAGENRIVITPSAWRDLTRNIRDYQTLSVCIAAAPKITLNDGSAPPTYEESNEKRSHSRSSSSSSRASSRSPRLATRALGFLGKRSS